MIRNCKIPCEAKGSLLAVPCIRYFPDQLAAEFHARGWRRVGVMGSDSALRALRRRVPGFDYVRLQVDGPWKDFSGVDAVLDFALDAYLRGFLPNGGKLVSLKDVLVPIAMAELRAFAREGRVKLVLVDGPRAERIPNLNAVERRYVEEHASFEQMAADERFLRAFCATDRDYDYATCRQLGVFGGWKRVFNGVVECLADVQADYINVKDGVRKTAGVPDSPEGFVHVFGSCLAQGACVADENTIESFLQYQCNAAGQNRAVVNHGVGDGRFLLNDVVGAMTVPVNGNDVFVFIDDLPLEACPDAVDSSAWFSGKSRDEVMFFNNAYHANARANELIAARIGEMIGEFAVRDAGRRRDYFSWKGVRLHPVPGPDPYCSQVVPYMRHLARVRRREDADCAAVLINADPFTLGHRKLIETALEEYSHVYVFLLDQAATFTFRDRHEMARRGVSGLSATVVRAEDFYASSRNFPEYFNRSSYVPGSALSRTVEVDVRMLIEKVFPFLRIRARYLGEEVPQSVTWKYNELLQKIDAEYGLRTVLVPRLRVDGDVISASTVRRLYAQDDFPVIRKLVPAGVFEYLAQLRRGAGQ